VWKTKRDLYGLQTVPSARVARHVALLRSRGVTVNEIASAAPCSTSTIARIQVGKALYRATAVRILAVPVPSKPATTGRAYSHTPTVGARRRLQALATLGWSCKALAEHTHLSFHTLRAVYYRDHITTPTNVAITALYDRFWDVPATPSRSSTQTKVNALRSGWVGPLAWDDDDLDNPDATPNLTGGTGRRKVHVDDIEWLLDLYPAITTRDLAARMGVGVTSIQNHLRRKDRRDLLDRLNRNAILATGCGRREPAA
jgi:lambda repressor-like predicted transcriptional regulator